MTKYVVNWDNGASACGTFEERFDTFEEADAWGKSWAADANLDMFGTTEPEGDCYTYDVVEATASEPGDDFLTDDEKDAHEGSAHFRMTRECRP